MRRKIAAGNWKMNGNAAALAELEDLARIHPAPSVGILICPPATLIGRAAATTGDSAIAIGGQDCHAAASGAHTGDLSAGMLAEAGAVAVILGHSERRTDHGETSVQVAAKARAACAAGLTAIICIGETLAEREAGTTLAVLDDQLAGSLPDTAAAADIVIAYEPVWAIGTGLTPSTEQIDEVHRHLRAHLAARGLADIPLLYGGSVKGSNAAGIFAVEDVDGALVGGASLKAADFSPIIAALEAS